MSSSPIPQTSRSSVSTKIFLIVAIFSLPIGVLAYLLAANYTPQIEVAQLELSGNALQKPLMKALSGLLRSKNVLQGCDAANCASDLAAQANLINASLAAADSINTQYAADLKTSLDDLAKKDQKQAALSSLEAEWKVTAAAAAKITTPSERAELAANYDQLAGHIKQLVNYFGNTSNLILDPDLDSYYLVDVTLLAMLDAATQIDTVAATANKIASGAGSAVEQAALANESALLQQTLDRVGASNRTTFDSDAANHGVSPTLLPNLRPALQQYQTAITAYLGTLKTAWR